MCKHVTVSRPLPDGATGWEWADRIRAQAPDLAEASRELAATSCEVAAMSRDLLAESRRLLAQAQELRTAGRRLLAENHRLQTILTHCRMLPRRDARPDRRLVPSRNAPGPTVTT
jgi:hypothetical protein